MKAGVVGVGHLGFHHARILKELVDEVAVFDINSVRADEVADRLGLRSVPDFKDLLDFSDFIIVACTTSAHYKVTREALLAGKHVLVEKPITDNVIHAKEMIELSEKMNKVLAVGHVERFNPAVIAASTLIKQPMFVEGHRLSAFGPRGTDVSVVMDLMIHDIDLILSFVTSPIKEVRSSGLAVLTDKLDIVSTRIAFENGAVVNMTASRISREPKRKLRFFEMNRYVSVDFASKTVEAFGIENGEISSISVEVQEKDALEAELTNFIASCKGECTPVVTGEAGVRALIAAELITDSIKDQDPFEA